MSLVAVDANVLIYFVERHPEFGEPAQALLQAVARGEQSAVGSELLYLEVLAHSGLSSEADVKKTREFIERSGIKLQAIDKFVLLDAARLRRQFTSLKSPDAIHLATALKAGATHFVSNDRKLLKQKIPGIKLIGLANIKEAIRFSRDINRLAP
ncbi:MAG TPA: PIN domain-containing protein [Candidatus Saccharimonadales bacterium]|jgi:predicted nucleic acid-binding protein